MPISPRILFVIDALVLGGAQRILIGIANDAAERGAAVEIVTLRATRPLPQIFKLHGSIRLRSLQTAYTHATPLRVYAGLIRTIRALQGIIAEVRPSCVVSFLDEVNLVTLLAVPPERTDLRVIVSERSYPKVSFQKRYDPLGVIPLIGHAARRYLYPRADAVVTVTERGASFLRSEGLSNVIVIPNPVPLPPAEERVHAPEKVVVGMGRLAREKRFDLLIEAFASLIPSFPDWRLRIYGDGPLRGSLLRRIERSNLTPQIELCGVTDAPAAILGARPIFALSSDIEGFPGALTEAMASGCAVVATDCPTGPSELIRHGVDGLLVRPRDPSALAASLGAVMSSEVLRRRLGEAARTITERYPPAMILSRWWDEMTTSFPQARP